MQLSLSLPDPTTYCINYLPKRIMPCLETLPGEWAICIKGGMHVGHAHQNRIKALHVIKNNNLWWSYNFNHQWDLLDEWTKSRLVYCARGWNWYCSPESCLALNNFKNRCQKFRKIFFSKIIFLHGEKRILWNILKKWRIFAVNLPK